MTLALVVLVVSYGCLNSMFVSCPVSTSNAAHYVPHHSGLEDFVNSLGTIKKQTESAVDSLADAYAAAVVKCAERHTSCSITSEALNSHICHYVGSVLDVGSLSEWGVSTGYVMVVTTHHYRTDLALSNELVECKTDVTTTLSILIEDTSLSTNNEFVLLSVSDPDPVVSVLTTSVRVDNFHSSLVSSVEVFWLTGQANPSEWAIAIVKEDRSHDVFNV